MRIEDIYILRNIEHICHYSGILRRQNEVAQTCQ